MSDPRPELLSVRQVWGYLLFTATHPIACLVHHSWMCSDADNMRTGCLLTQGGSPFNYSGHMTTTVPTQRILAAEPLRYPSNAALRYGFQQSNKHGRMGAPSSIRLANDLTVHLQEGRVLLFRGLVPIVGSLERSPPTARHLVRHILQRDPRMVLSVHWSSTRFVSSLLDSRCREQPLDRYR